MNHRTIICDIFTGLCRVEHSLEPTKIIIIRLCLKRESGDLLLPRDDYFVFSLLNNVQVLFTDTSPKGKQGERHLWPA